MLTEPEATGMKFSIQNHAQAYASDQPHSSLLGQDSRARLQLELETDRQAQWLNWIEAMQMYGKDSGRTMSTSLNESWLYPGDWLSDCPTLWQTDSVVDMKSLAAITNLQPYNWVTSVNYPCRQQSGSSIMRLSIYLESGWLVRSIRPVMGEGFTKKNPRDDGQCQRNMKIWKSEDR